MLNSIDIFIGLGVLIFFALGIKSGFLKSFLSVCGVYGEIYLAQLATPMIIKTASFLEHPEAKTGYVIVFFVLFIIFFVVFEFLLGILKNLVNISILGPADKILGGIVSIFKAMLIAGIVIEVVYILPLTDEQLKYANQSFLKDWAIKSFKISYPFAIKTAEKTSGFISEKLGPGIKQKSSMALGMITTEASKISENFGKSPTATEAAKGIIKNLDGHPRI
ncbi:MAG: CvpA family protein [Candidatus Margulisiibacteriota bacterium]